MDGERQPTREPEEDERLAEPSVPVPPDFPEDARVVHPPGLSIEEQRRKAAGESRKDAEKEGIPAEGTRHKRGGGGLSNSRNVG